MTKLKKPGSTGGVENTGISQRLDALIRISLEGLYKKRKLQNEADAARLLKSVGLGPTEIAKVLGKKTASDVAPYLYPKKNKR